MIRIFPAVPPAVRSSLESVLAQALAAGSPPPAWVAVEDDNGLWIREAAAAFPGERARGVIAARTEAGLVTAVRLGIGGALPLPPSTVAARASLEAAAAAKRVQCPDPGLVDLLAADSPRLLAVGWAGRDFWRNQIGEAEMAAALTDLAFELGELPVVLVWPALLVGERPVDTISDAWRRVVTRRGLSSDGTVVVDVEGDRGRGGTVAAAIRGLIESDCDGDARVGDGPALRPVFELPSGRQVGWWTSSQAEPASGSEWTAEPIGSSAAGIRWKLTDPDGSESTVDDVLHSNEVEAPAARLPGWVGIAIGTGRPAGLLLERLAKAAAERGVPLWVPNVDHAALPLVLRQPGTLWVDGPAAPASDR